MVKKEDFDLLREKLSRKAEAQTKSMEKIASSAKKINENLDSKPAQQQVHQVSVLTSSDQVHVTTNIINNQHTENQEPYKILKDHENHNHHYYNLSYIAFGAVTLGAVIIGGLYWSGFFQAAKVATNELELYTPAQLKAMAAGLIGYQGFGQTNKDRFLDTLHKGLITRAKDTPINVKQFEEFIKEAFNEAGDYISKNIKQIQTVDFIADLKIDATIARHIQNPINEFGSPGKSNVFSPMLKAMLGAGIVFSKIKATFGYKIEDEADYRQQDLSFDDCDFLSGQLNSTNIDCYYLES